MVFSKGATLKDGKYEIEEQLGAGRLSMTYLARETRTGTRIAIKTLDRRRDFVERHFELLNENFINQTVALAACTHPYIVRVYAQGFFEGELWCAVMEYIPGESLADRVAASGPLPESDAIALAHKLGSALEVIHASASLHRDICPHNILLRDRDLNSPVLMDLGIAGNFSDADLPRDLEFDRLRPYTAPESESSPGPWSDLYALAASLYFLTTDRTPPLARTRFSTPHALVPPQQYAPTLSDRAQAALLAGMALDADKRPQAIADWLPLLPPMVFSPGETLKEGKYEIEDLLEEGRFGTAYLARETHTNTRVVLKTLDRRRDFVRQHFDALNESFINQTVALAACSHPHIARVYAQGFFEGDLWCLVLEYVPGENLETYLARNGPASETEAIALVAKLGAALETVHGKGFWHRDLRPSTILLRDGDLDAPVVMDFGLDGLPPPDLADPYAASEQFEPQLAPGPPADLYALAAVAYFASTGRTPAPAPKRQTAPDALISPQQQVPELSDRFNRAVLAGLALDPEQRSPSVTAWLSALRAARPAPKPKPKSKPTPIVAPSPTPPPWLTRRRLFIFSGLAATGFLAAVGRSLLVSRAPTRDVRDPPSSSNARIEERTYDFVVVTIDESGQELNRQTVQNRGYMEALGSGQILEMAYIPSGSFQMGSPPNPIGGGLNEKARDRDEGPQRMVTLPAFAIGRFPVTQAQWEAVAALPRVRLELDPRPSVFSGRDRPVDTVSWEEASEFCDRLSSYSGREYRLPSEAEWEYACRAGTTTPFHFGETITADLVNYRANFTYASEDRGRYRKETTAVGQFPPNAFGLHDMHGNVWEWCADIYHPTYEGAPTDGSPRLEGEAEGRPRVRRGGSWFNVPENCRSANRAVIDSEKQDQAVDGFRVVSQVQPESETLW